MRTLELRINEELELTKDIYGLVGFKNEPINKRIKFIKEGEQGTAKNIDLLQVDGTIVLESLKLKNILGACAIMGSYDLKDYIKEELQKFFFEDIGFESLSGDTKNVIKIYVVSMKMIKGTVERDSSEDKVDRIFRTVTKNIFNCKKETEQKYIEIFDKNIKEDFKYDEMEKSISL